MRKGSGKGNLDAPQEGMMAPASVAVSVSAIDKDFSRPPQSHGPGHSVMLRQPRRPPTRATTVTQPPALSHRDPLTKTDELKGITPSRGEPGQQPRGRAQPPPPAAVTDRTQLQEQTRPLWPGRARQAREAPVAALQSTRRRPSHPQQEKLHQPPGADLGMPDLALPSPDGPQIGPDLGQGRAARGAADLPAAPAAKRPRHRHRTTRSSATRGAPPAATPCPPEAPPAAEESPAPPGLACG
nr:uncharacterized protein LOC127304401 [Lolium perenne]